MRRSADRNERYRAKVVAGDGGCMLWTGYLNAGTDNMQDASRKGRIVAPKGERNRHAKLTAEHVREIRSVPSRAVKLDDLADHYGVHKSTLIGIRCGKTWRHL